MITCWKFFCKYASYLDVFNLWHSAFTWYISICATSKGFIEDMHLISIYFCFFEVNTGWNIFHLIVAILANNYSYTHIHYVLFFKVQKIYILYVWMYVYVCLFVYLVLWRLIYDIVLIITYHLHDICKFTITKVIINPEVVVQHWSKTWTVLLQLRHAISIQLPVPYIYRNRT